MTLWGLRLTYNFYRKGGYDLSEEDYRWRIVIKEFEKYPIILWEIFHLVFICIF